MCTIFRTNKDKQGHFFVGKNYDVPDPCKVMVFLNKPREEKQALIKPPETPVSWISKYGSITVNEVCKEFPCSGMNEKGLIVEQTTLWNTLYPDLDNRPAIKELQWIQLMLDTCATTQEVIKRSREIRISQEAARLQYFICDASGEVCIIEFILGEMVLFQGENLRYAVIANDMFQTSIDYLSIHEGYGGKKALKGSSLSIDRFAITVDAVLHNEHPDAEDCFEILKLTGFELTQWSIVYNPLKLLVYYRSKNSPDIKTIDVFQFDFAGMSLPLIKEIDDGGGDFSDFSREKNLELIRFFYNESRYFKSIKVSEEEMELQARL